MADLHLLNLSLIPNSKIEKIIQTADLPSSKLLLVVGEERHKCNEHFGETIPRQYIEEAHWTKLKKYKKENWDIGIIMYKQACKLHNKYPAFFTQLLGHELGHAKACLDNIKIHLLYCLIQQDIKTASGGEIAKWSELPHEIRFDQIGKYIAESEYSHRQLNNEIRVLLNSNLLDSENLKQILKLKPTKKVDNLFNELVKFAKHYARQLEYEWRKEAECAKNLREATIYTDANIDWAIKLLNKTNSKEHK